MDHGRSDTDRREMHELRRDVRRILDILEGETSQPKGHWFVREAEKRIAELEAVLREILDYRVEGKDISGPVRDAYKLLDLQPCGHPVSAIVGLPLVGS